MNEGSADGPAPRGAAFFTICSNNYMPFAKVLLESVRRHHPDAALFVCLADEPIDWPGLYDGDFTVVPANTLGIPEFRSFAFQYDIMEFNTAVKPFMFIHLLETLGFGQAVYFDPDILMLAPLSGVLGELAAGASLVLTPHLRQPAEGDSDPDDVLIMLAGVYNLGFLAVSRCEEASRIMHWWARRLRVQCVNQQRDGLFVDQKFMDLVPGFAPSARICHDAAVNLAYWNLRQVVLEGGEDGWTVDGRPLVFFHFSGFDARDLRQLSKHTRHFRTGLSAPLTALMRLYAGLLIERGYGTIPSDTYAYGRFRSGTVIPPLVRRMFRDQSASWPEDPFDTYEAFLHLAAPGATRKSSRFVVTQFMRFLWHYFPSLRDRLDLANPEHVKELVRWYVNHARNEWRFDARLIAPAAERVGHWRLPDAGKVLRARAEPGRADVSVVGYLRTTSGVGEVGRHTMRALALSGLRVEGVDVDLGVVSDRGERGVESWLRERGTGAVQLFANVNADQLPHVLAHMAPHLAEPAYRVAMPAWELEVFPDAWLPAFDGVDEVWAQTAWVQSMLVRKLEKPILHIPVVLTLDPPPPLPRERFGLPDGAFLYYLAFDFLSFVERKNPRGALEAFRRLRRLAGRRRVGLVVKSLNGARFPEQAAAFRAEVDGDPDVVLIDETLSRDETLGLIAACDAVLSLHRAEGLGLLVAEAMALGKPVIATDYAATTELLQPATGYPVDYRLIPVRPGEYPMWEGQSWADPDLDHAAWLMRKALEEPADAALRVAAATKFLQDNHSPGPVVARQRRRLAELSVC